MRNGLSQKKPEFNIRIYLIIIIAIWQPLFFVILYNHYRFSLWILPSMKASPPGNACCAGEKRKKEDFLLEKFVQKKGFLKTCAYIILYIRENG